MRAAAFDLSSETGWAAWDGAAVAPILDKKRVLHWDRDPGIMVEHFRRWLGQFFDEHQPEAIGVEAPAVGTHGDINTIHRQAMIRGMLHWAAHIKQVPIYAYAPSQWRKGFIGFGQGPRQQKGQPKPPPVNWKVLAKRRCRALGWDCKDNHNAAEAGGVLVALLKDILPLADRPAFMSADGLLLPLPELNLVHSS